MSLELSTLDTSPTEQSWIRLNKDKQALEGLLWDVKPPKSYQYTITATDSGGCSGSYDIELVVQVPLEKPTHTFTVTVDENYSNFANKLSLQLNMYDRLSKAFSGSILKFESVGQGSVVIGYSIKNDKISGGGVGSCNEVKRLTQNVFTSEGKASAKFLSNLQPYKVERVTFVPLGECEGILTGMEADIQEPGTGEGREDDGVNIIVIIIPIVVIIVIVIIIIVIVVCVRRRRERSMEVGKNGEYIEKGVPVRFDEEMKDTDGKNAAEMQPLMDESPKPQPPAYPQNGKETTPLNSDSAAEAYQPPTPPMSEHNDTDKS